jgi:hypothetical protein
MSRGLTSFVIASGVVTTLIVIGAPWLRLASSANRPPDLADVARLAQAHEFFEKYIRLDHDRDLALLDLYSATAVVIDRRPSPNGQTSDLKIPFTAFRPMLRGLFVVSQAAGDPPSVYTGTKEYLEADGVRIETDCYSQSDEFQRHLTMFIRPSDEDSWLIYELIVDSPEVRQ